MYTDMKRRLFLKQSLAVGAMGVALGSGLLMPKTVLAAWPKEAFESKNVAEGLKNLLGSGQHTANDDIAFTAPEIAENGAVVPLKVETTIADVESITIVAVNNPVPLVASFNLNGDAIGYISTRIKMGKTGNVIAVVKAGGKLHSAQKEVKVTVGGCGG